MLYSKISAKNVFIIIKTCSSHRLPLDHAGGRPSPDPLFPPAFQFLPGSSRSRRNPGQIGMERKSFVALLVHSAMTRRRGF